MPKRPKPVTPSPPQAAGRLGGVRSLAHDEDERPSREDRTYGETIFNRGVVPLPKFLRGRRRTG
ncbi:MAG TPA: hypothetical protein VKB28_16480 [Solirubrobacteraceae bacterium]|jgi:hypothetical protein|nr:hypothetical protein [Solirubrobacteraceae bacterium]